jgi:cell division transport system permease protein
VRALNYFVTEAARSLWRRRGAAAVAVLTIAAGLFVLGFFLVVSQNLDRVVGRWSESAELSVYFADEATDADIAGAESLVDASGLATGWERLSKEQAAARFREDFPDLAETASQMDGNPFPASLEVRLAPGLGEEGAAVDALARNLDALPGVADVRYDRRWIARLHGVVQLVRGLALLVVGMLAVAAALTVSNVVRLAAVAREDEIQIMQLVGAPIAYVRGPFIAEGVLQGGVGALLALVTLWAGLAALDARYGALAAGVLGGPITFLPLGLWFGVLGGGMLLGCLGGFVVARGVR